MKIKLLGKNLDKIRVLLEKFEMYESDTPELIVTYGGDGALLGAQRDYPELPKLAMRDAETAPTCQEHSAEKILQLFSWNELPLQRIPLLCADCSGSEICGINDVVLHSADYVSALRYNVYIDGSLYAANVVGDGICFAGIHGSTAYYRSITRGVFRTGVGVAFINSTETVDHLVLPESSSVTVEILRGPGVVMADNDPRRIKVDVGGTVKFQQSGKFAQIYALNEFMCQNCRTLRNRCSR